jgi:hypothetical protein
MEFALESAADGKRLRLDPAKPLVLAVKRGDQSGGEIVVGIKDGRPFLDNRSTASCQVNDLDRAAAALQPGDRLQLGALRFILVAIGEPDVVEPARSAPSSDRQPAAQRRISASRMAAVEPASNQSSGLLKRVSAAFSGRAEKQRLEELETERRKALLDAGRRSLGEGGAFGIAADDLARLQRGQSATIDPARLPGLQRWREDRQRLVRLDAEIAALRQALGLGADPEAVILVAPTLKSDEKAKLERAFATMDAVATQELAGEQPAKPPADMRPRNPPRRNSNH